MSLTQKGQQSVHCVSFTCWRLLVRQFGPTTQLKCASLVCADGFQDLCQKLSQLEKESSGAPLVCVTDKEEAEPSWPARSMSDVLSDEGMSDSGTPRDGAQQPDEWEVL